MFCQPLWNQQTLYSDIKLGKGSKKMKKKWLDLSNAHLTPASQAADLPKVYVRVQGPCARAHERPMRTEVFDKIIID